MPEKFNKPLAPPVDEEPPEQDLRNALQMLAVAHEPMTEQERDAILKRIETAYRKIRRGYFA